MKIFFSIIVVAKQSHNNITNDVEDVGTILFGSASFNFGYKIFISLAFNNMLFELEAIPIIFIRNRLANFSKFNSSEVFPELEIIIKISLFLIVLHHREKHQLDLQKTWNPYMRMSRLLFYK